MIEQGRKLNQKYHDKNKFACYVTMVETERLKMKSTFCFTAIGERIYRSGKDLFVKSTKLSPFLRTWKVTIKQMLGLPRFPIVFYSRQRSSVF